MILIGYGGHAFVACSIATAMGIKIIGYCDQEEKKSNPFTLHYFGSENNIDKTLLLQHGFFIAVGENSIRQKIFQSLKLQECKPVNLIHPSAVICSSAVVASANVMISPNVVIQPLVSLGAGVICNTGCIIEHECTVEAFAHIAPGTILCGNVKVGTASFIGAGAVVKQGITIGDNVIVGAGAVVVKNIPDNTKVMGNPARLKS